MNRPRSSSAIAPPPAARRWYAVAALATAGLACWQPGPAHAAATVCEAQSGALRTTVVELYTSEGCSSCPPADRWLSSLKPRPGSDAAVLPMAFHVTYWDRLGWTDRFASPAHTDRQYALSAASGGKFVYTPQVIVDGADWRRWPALPAGGVPAEFDLRLSRRADTVTAQVAGRHGRPLRAAPVGGYWVVLEDGHRSEVRAGENAGATLRHDHVVRAYQPVADWPAEREQRWQWQPPRRAAADRDTGISQRVAFVVVDAQTRRPLQALALTCPD